MPWWATLLLLQIPPLDLPAANPHTTPADVEQGRRLYQGRCAGCHGPRGEGGKGADLAVPRLARGGEDRALYRIIRYGIPETEMPGSLMDAHEIWQTAAFVRTLGQTGRVSLPGTAASGEKLFNGKAGCRGCHALAGNGGLSGPDLAGIGARRGPAFLRAKLLDPAANVPPSYRRVTVTTRDGKSLSGVRVNEDTWSIQIQDSSGRFHSFFKNELRSLDSQKTTPMPSYASRLTDAERDDLVAFLSAQGKEE